MKSAALTPEAHLSARDPKLAAIIKALKLEDYKPRDNRFQALLYSIIGQQLSVKAADTIRKRFCSLFKNGTPQPDTVLKMPTAKMRAAGLSRAKAEYVKDLAHRVNSGEIELKNIHKLEDEEIVEHLVRVKGIGRWTAEMFLMFSLRRPDVFSHGDLGLQNAIKALYGHKKLDQKKLAKLSDAWRPHRTLACLYLWASLDQGRAEPKPTKPQKSRSAKKR